MSERDIQKLKITFCCLINSANTCVCSWMRHKVLVRHIQKSFDLACTSVVWLTLIDLVKWCRERKRDLQKNILRNDTRLRFLNVSIILLILLLSKVGFMAWSCLANKETTNDSSLNKRNILKLSSEAWESPRMTRRQKKTFSPCAL